MNLMSIISNSESNHAANVHSFDILHIFLILKVTFLAGNNLFRKDADYEVHLPASSVCHSQRDRS